MSNTGMISSIVRLLGTEISFGNSRQKRRRRPPSSAVRKAQRESAEARPRSDSMVTVFEGEITPGITTQFSVAGKDIAIDSDTWIFGEIMIGSTASVHVVPRIGDQLYARKVIVTSEGQRKRERLTK
jgi:hypothetical protein